MNQFNGMTNDEVAVALAHSIRRLRLSPTVGMSQEELSRRSGAGLTPIKRFEKTGKLTLTNFIAVLRALDLLDGLETLIPDASEPSPLELLHQSRQQKPQRQRAPRSK